MNDPLLDIQHLQVNFYTPEGIARAVAGVSFSIPLGETVGLVGESGCGKSITALATLGLIPSPPGRIEGGQAIFEGRDLLKLNPDSLRRLRGSDISMIFQEPMTSLNPVMPIGWQVAEPLWIHGNMTRSAALARAADYLDQVMIPAARKRMNDFPHQLSGGMRQRVMIAMAMICGPKLLIADEPTTALDVTIQAQILNLMMKIKKQSRMSLLLITHDLGVIAQTADRVVVMYAGQVVEKAGVVDLFDRPFHPYTKGLIKSMPRLGGRVGRQSLYEIPGTVPPLTEKITGCSFADRCPYVFDPCRRQPPDLEKLGEGRYARCWLHRFSQKGPENG